MSTYELPKLILIISFDLFVKAAAAILYFYERFQVLKPLMTLWLYTMLIYNFNLINTFLYQCMVWCKFVLHSTECIELNSNLI